MKYSKIIDSLYIKGRIGWKGLKKEEYLHSSPYRIINGKSVKDGGIDWSETGYITKERYDESPEIMLEPNDIVITKDGTIGKVAMVDKLDMPTTVASGLFVLRNINSQKWDTKFLYYYLISPMFKGFVASRTEGSVIPHLYQRDFEQLELPEFSLAEQQKISKILSAIDGLISENNKVNHHLAEIAKTIFKSWFVDFEPFEGKQPSFWKDSLLFDMATVTYGKNLPTKKLLPSGYRVFGGNGQIGYYSEYLYKDERILISCRGAASGSVRLSRPYSFVTNNSLVINEESKNLYSYVKQWALNRQFFDAVTGSAQPQVTVDSLKLITLLRPDEETLGKFSKTIQPIYDMIERNTEESEHLIALRDELLPKLMSGELSISD